MTNRKRFAMILFILEGILIIVSHLCGAEIGLIPKVMIIWSWLEILCPVEKE